MKKSLLSASRPCLMPLVGLLAMAGSASAAVSLLGTATFDAGSNRYVYNYSVTNSGSPDEIIQVTFPVSRTAALLGIVAPTGFKLTYDTVGARVNFVWDDDDFTPQTFAQDTTISGFVFTSAEGPGQVQFTASDVNMDFNGFTAAPVPEPGSLVLGLAAAPLLLRRRRA